MARKKLVERLKAARAFWSLEVDQVIRRRLAAADLSLEQQIRHYGKKEGPGAIPPPAQWNAKKSDLHEEGLMIESPTHRLSWRISAHVETVGILASPVDINIRLEALERREAVSDIIELAYETEERQWQFAFDRFRQCIDPAWAGTHYVGFGDALEFNVRRILTQHDVRAKRGVLPVKDPLFDPFDPRNYSDDFQSVPPHVAQRLLGCMVHEFEQTWVPKSAPRKKRA